MLAFVESEKGMSKFLTRQVVQLLGNLIKWFRNARGG